MKTYNKLYEEICSMNNLANAWRNARKGKTKKDYVIKFEKEIRQNLLELREELLNQTYKPKSLVTFILRDPKTRKISKADFRDRIVHHAVIRIIGPLFDKRFIYDSCANRKEKGNLFALKRFKYFVKKVSENGNCLKNNFNDTNFIFGYCLKADIRHYFQEISHDVLLEIIQKKITDEKTIWLIKQILNNSFQSSKDSGEGVSAKFDKKGMPLGNLTSQFFANVYLNELDQFVKNTIRAKYYIRYVDDFVILHKSKLQLKIWKVYINDFLKNKLKLELHSDKSQIVHLFEGVDFVGFRNFYHFKLLRKRNIKKAKHKIMQFRREELIEDKFRESLNGWLAYAKWANSYNILKSFSKLIYLHEK